MANVATRRIWHGRAGMGGWKHPDRKDAAGRLRARTETAPTLQGKWTMVQSTPPQSDVKAHRVRIAQLGRRWLPGLLVRVGVSQLEADKLRQLDNGDELEAALLQAQIAVQMRGCARGESPGLVMEAIGTIGKLRRALDLADQDFARAVAMVDDLDRRWLRRLLFGEAPPSRYRTEDPTGVGTQRGLARTAIAG